MPYNNVVLSIVLQQAAAERHCIGCLKLCGAIVCISNQLGWRSGKLPKSGDAINRKWGGTPK
jgi:hypothetical protein